ncbi:MAG: sulfurtransferase [Thermodesulfobacteriota bacterium]
MAEQILYTPAEVEGLRQEGRVTLIDIRDKVIYKQGHIPGAVNAPEVFYYLSESTPDGLAALHETFRQTFSRAAVVPERLVIFYEDSLDSRYGSSCRGYWLLTYLGHRQVGILDGGFSEWRAAGLAVETAPAQPEPSRFVVQPRRELIATKEEVLAALSNPESIILDNRDAEEWFGDSSSPYGVDFAPRMGHIPGSRWIEWYRFMNREPVPAFRSPEEIQALCASVGIHPENDIIISCFKGSRASHSYVALKLAGFTRLRNYFASWNEWSRDPALPVAK